MLKAIIINECNEDKIVTILEETNKIVRNVSLKDIKSCITKIEKKLSSILYKKDWEGVRVDINPNAQTFSNAYKGTPEATLLTIERQKGSWKLICIRRDFCGKKVFVVSRLSAEKMAQFVVKNFENI